jgi:hypothetical protein
VNTPNKEEGRWEMEKYDYPSLYRSADDASINAQWWHLSTIKLYLFFLVAATFASTYVGSSHEWIVISAILFFATLGLAILQFNSDKDEIWYYGRAVAESIKTRTWRYIMRAEPYGDSVPDQKVKSKFCNDIRKILRQNTSLVEYLGQHTTDRLVTEKMSRIRSLDLENRLRLYHRDRIEDQLEWYNEKWTDNKNKSIFWFWVMIIFHSMAVILLIYKVANPSNTLPVESALMAGSGILTWMQVKRFKEHKSAYALTAYEIGIIKERSTNIETEEELSDFVKDTENAFSREHTQWIARRDT